MAPHIADGWPEVIPAPHTPNGRLIRREGPSPDDAASRIRELEAALATARAEGVREGIERVKAEPLSMVEYPSRTIVDIACDRAIAAFQKEQDRG